MPQKGEIEEESVAVKNGRNHSKKVLNETMIHSNGKISLLIEG